MPFKKNVHSLKIDARSASALPLSFHGPFRTYLLVDPSEREERVMDGLLVVAVNKHRELCTIQSSGGIMLLKDQVSASVGAAASTPFLTSLQ